MKDITSSREIIFYILWKGFCQGLYLEDVLSSYTFQDPRDKSLAYEICNGTIRHWSQLQWVAESLTSTGKLALKNREKALLFSALYQIYFLERVPHYAVIDETVKIAKKHCHSSMGSFFNGILRKASQTPMKLPTDNSIPSLAVRYSQTPFFVEQLVNENGKDNAIHILEASNTRPIHFVKEPGTPFHYAPITAGFADTEGYIQNPTPGTLMQFLAKSTPTCPETILDLCASPGGKLLLAHDLYPKAKLWANDISESRIELLRENIERFGLSVKIRMGNGETYPNEQLFDVIILDVPCSNSGVLNKRVEARWRISKESLADLKIVQQKLLHHASSLLKPGGSIWFLTCSILHEENEAVTNVPYLKKVDETTCYPDLEGFDGGYCCLLQK